MTFLIFDRHWSIFSIFWLFEFYQKSVIIKLNKISFFHGFIIDVCTIMKKILQSCDTFFVLGYDFDFGSAKDFLWISQGVFVVISQEMEIIFWYFYFAFRNKVVESVFCLSIFKEKDYAMQKNSNQQNLGNNKGH